MFNTSDRPLCECGCNEPVTKSKNRFITGHHLRLPENRRKEYTQEMITKQVKSLNEYYSKHSNSKKGTILIEGKFVDKSLVEFPLCGCGCGDRVQLYHNRYIHGHNVRGKAYNKGKKPWNKGKKGVQVAWNKGLNPKFSQLCGCGCGELTAPGAKYISGHNWRGKKQSPESIKKRVAKFKGQKRTGNWSCWSTGLTKETSEILMAISKQKKKLFSDKEWVRKWAKSKDMKPNKLEQRFDKLLQKLFPNEWKYVGDFQFLLGGKNPDFMNINGQKKLIEVFGDYWHEGQDPQDRIDHFKQYGFDCLVIWESELKHIRRVRNRLIEFNKGS